MAGDQYYNTWTGATWTTTNTYPYYVYVYPDTKCEPEEKVETCHLCKAPLVKKVSTTERQIVCDCEDDPCVCDEYIWNTLDEKTFECGTVVREGDLTDGVKRVTLGKGCIEVG